MTYIILGIFGFVFLLIFDILSMKEHVVGKYFFGLMGVSLIVASTIKICGLGNTPQITEAYKFISLVLAIVFLALLVYSVFIEVGGNTYQKAAAPELVTNGTYSLVRHPGVIWLFLTYFFAAIFFGNSYLLHTAFIWTLVNTIYIVLQEKYVLTRLFKNYGEYIKATPMVIPNFTSIKKFVMTENWRKA